MPKENAALFYSSYFETLELKIYVLRGERKEKRERTSVHCSLVGVQIIALGWIWSLLECKLGKCGARFLQNHSFVLPTRIMAGCHGCRVCLQLGAWRKGNSSDLHRCSALCPLSTALTARDKHPRDGRAGKGEAQLRVLLHLSQEQDGTPSGLAASKGSRPEEERLKSAATPICGSQPRGRAEQRLSLLVTLASVQL